MYVCKLNCRTHKQTTDCIMTDSVFISDTTQTLYTPSCLTKKKLQEKSLSSSKKKHLTRLLSQLESEMSKLKLVSLSPSELTKQRNKETVTKCFHKMGLVVPYDKTTELGYRPLPLTDSECVI